MIELCNGTHNTQYQNTNTKSTQKEKQRKGKTKKRESKVKDKSKNRTKTTLTSVTQIRGKTMTPKFGHKNTTIGDKYDKALTSAAIAVN